MNDKCKDIAASAIKFLVEVIGGGFKRMISHKLIMERVEWENIFSVDVPETWKFHEEGGVISLFNEENGVGVLQLSFARRKSPQETASQEARNLAENFASQRGWPVPFESIHSLDIGGYPVTVFSIQEIIGDEREYWRVWHIMGKERIAFVTYNCIASDKKEEERECDLIIASFRWG